MNCNVSIALQPPRWLNCIIKPHPGSSQSELNLLLLDLTERLKVWQWVAVERSSLWKDFNSERTCLCPQPLCTTSPLQPSLPTMPCCHCHVPPCPVFICRQDWQAAVIVSPREWCTIWPFYSNLFTRECFTFAWIIFKLWSMSQWLISSCKESKVGMHWY